MISEYEKLLSNIDKWPDFQALNGISPTNNSDADVAAKDVNEMDFVPKDEPAPTNTPTDNMDLSAINNMMKIYADKVNDQYKLDDSRYKDIESKLNNSYKSDLTPEQYQKTMEQANTARAIANVFQAANLGGNGAAFKSIGDSNYESAMSPITQSKYFQTAGRQKAEDQIKLGNLQRENLKSLGGDVENTLQAGKNYNTIKTEKDKNDPSSALSKAENSNVRTQLLGLSSILTTAADKNTPEFQTAATTLTDLANKLPGMSYNDQQNAIKLAKEQVDAVKGIVGAKNAGKMVGIAGFNANTGADWKDFQKKMAEQDLELKKLREAREGNKVELAHGLTDDKMLIKFGEALNGLSKHSRDVIGQSAAGLAKIHKLKDMLNNPDLIITDQVLRNAEQDVAGIVKNGVPTVSDSNHQYQASLGRDFLKKLQYLSGKPISVADSDQMKNLFTMLADLEKSSQDVKDENARFVVGQFAPLLRSSQDARNLLNNAGVNVPSMGIKVKDKKEKSAESKPAPQNAPTQSVTDAQLKAYAKKFNMDEAKAAKTLKDKGYAVEGY